MNDVIGIIYRCDGASNLQTFFFVTASTSFIFFWIAMFVILAVSMAGEKITDELKMITGGFLFASCAFFFFYSLMPSLSAEKEIIKATIATALADGNLSQSERDYLQSLTASYSSGKERDTTDNIH